MSFWSEFKTVSGNVGQALWPSPTRSKVFLESLGRGFSWALVLLFILAIPVFALSLNSEDFNIGVSADDFARSVFLLAVAASGSFIQLLVDGAALQAETYYLDIGASPSLITLLVGYIAYRAGSRIKEFRNSSDSVRQLAGFSSLGLGLGFAGALYLATVAGSGSVLEFGVVELAPMSLSGLLWAFFVVSIPAWLGALRSGNRKAATSWRWAYSAIRTFAVFYLSLVAVFGLVLLAYLLIAPVFALSEQQVGAAPALDLDGWVILSAVVVFLLFLPTLVFNLFAIAVGAEYALQFDFLGLDVMSFAENLPWIDGLSTVTSFGSVSVLSTIGIWAFLIVIAAVVFASLISGLAATGKVTVDVVFRRDLLTGVAVVFFVGLVLRSITQFSAIWTNKGVAPKDMTDGSLPLREGFLTIGITTASFALVLAIISLFIVLGASSAASFMQESFPRLSSLLSDRGLEANIDRGILPQIFGKFVASLATLAIVLPLGVAVIERAWASLDNPGDKFREVQSLVESGDLETVKEFFTAQGGKKAKWLPDQVLEAARPAADAREPLQITNGWDEPWKTGQLDAYGRLSWDTGSGTVLLNLGSESKVSQNLRFIHHANYTATAQRLNLSVSYGEFLTAAGRTEISINGVTVPVGSYDAIPGTYTVKSPGFQLIAPSETVFVTNGSDMIFTAKEEALVPAAANSILNKEIDRIAQECGDFSSLDSPRCFSFENIFAAREPVGSAPAEEYFAIKTGDFKVLKTTCSGSGSDLLLSASSVMRISSCSTEMTFEVTYFESKIEVSDVFSTQIYNACPGLSSPCNRSRQVKVGTREAEVIGDRIGRGTMSSSVPFPVEVMGTLRANGSFEIINFFEPPIYELEPEIEEPEVAEPVKLLGYYKDLDALRRSNPTGEVGDGYVVSPDLLLYVWDGRDWTLVGRR